MPYCGKHFWDPSGTYFLFADFVHFYIHWTYMLIFRRIFSANIDGRNLIFHHKLHICIPFCGKRFFTCQMPTSCCRLSWLLYTLNIYAHFSSHFSQQLLMAEICYFVPIFILVCTIVGSVFGSVRFLIPVFQLNYILSFYRKFPSHFSEQPLITAIWYLFRSLLFQIDWQVQEDDTEEES